jgi:HTH-type transcriptional regulator / antitoxin HipB
MAQHDYSRIQTVEELYPPVGVHREQRHLKLETVSGVGNLRTRIPSKFEWGKEITEFGMVLKALRTLELEIIVQPRRQVVSTHRTGMTHQETT